MAHPLAILHVLRAPVGGLFRHVVDLATAQAMRGHRVGLIADASSGGRSAEETLAALAPRLALGISRVHMSRHLGWSDLSAVLHVARRAAAANADVVHGHGAKGGAYARLARCGRAVRVYTPHGGSLHYSPSSAIGFVYLVLERVLAERTDVFLFESAYGRETFNAKVGAPRGIVRVVHNGLRPDEFAPVVPASDASDLVFVGELRELKGVDVLISAMRQLHGIGRRVTATIVGEGPDAEAFHSEAVSLGDAIRFVGAKPARIAFTQGRCLVVPSRAESLPYVVLEAAAAGLPVIATRVGGMPEIFGTHSAALIPADDPHALTRAIARLLDDPPAATAAALDLRQRVQVHFCLRDMTDQVIEAYHQALDARGLAHGRPALSVS